RVVSVIDVGVAAGYYVNSVLEGDLPGRTRTVAPIDHRRVFGYLALVGGIDDRGQDDIAKRLAFNPPECTAHGEDSQRGVVHVGLDIHTGRTSALVLHINMDRGIPFLLPDVAALHCPKVRRDLDDRGALGGLVRLPGDGGAVIADLAIRI